MKIIVSPAKTMRVNVEECTTPHFIARAYEIREYLRSLDKDTLAKIWKCNMKLVDENIRLLNEGELDKDLTRAIYAYDGLQFKNLEIDTLSTEAMDYLNNNLFILSGMYGALRPSDGIIPYRLEMQARAGINNTKAMYDYWEDSIYKYITEADNIIINLASKEYSDAITPYLGEGKEIINISFGTYKDGKLIVKSTESKIMRGRFLRFMAENRIQSVDDLKKFTYKEMAFSSELSSNSALIFINR